MELLQKKCPACRSTNITAYKTYTTKHHGSRQLYHCQDCDAVRVVRGDDAHFS